MLIIGILTIIIGVLAIIVNIILGLEQNEKDSNKHTYKETVIQETVTQHHKVWYNRGVAFSKLGLYKEAIEAYNKAVENKPDFYEAWTNKGKALAALGRHDEALEAYNVAIKIKPNYHKAWSHKASTLRKLGLHKEASAAFNIAIKILQNQFNSKLDSLDKKLKEMEKKP